MMIRRIIVHIYISFIYFSVFVKCNFDEYEIINHQLDDLLKEIDTSRLSSTLKTTDNLLSVYESELENENRNELIVTNVTSQIDPLLIEFMDNLEFISDGKHFYLVGSIYPYILINIMDENKLHIVDQYRIVSREKILTFKIFCGYTENPRDISLIVVVAFEIYYGSELRWYKFNDNNLQQFWSLTVDRYVRKLEYFQHNMQNRLIIFKDMYNNYFEIDIHSFVIAGNSMKFQLVQRLYPAEITNLKLCTYNNRTMILFQVRDNIFVYNYHSVISEQEYLELIQQLESVNLIGSVCFYIENILYLTITGSNTLIFKYIDNIFRIDTTSTDILQNIGDIYWIKCIPLDTHKGGILLLVQLKNLSMFSLSWQNRGLEKNYQPFFTSDLSIDLSKITVIPEVGFIYKNKIIKIETQIRQLQLSNSKEIQELIESFRKLMVVFQKQEFIITETERLIDEYHEKNSIADNGMWNISKLNLVDKNISMTNENKECKKLWDGAINSTCHEFNSSHDDIVNSLKYIDEILSEINLNMNNTIEINTIDISLFDNIEVVGDVKIHGMMALKNLTFNIINNISMNDIYKYTNDDNYIIEGEKFFSSIDVEELTLHTLNDIPIDNIIFDTELIDYTGINFSDITTLEVEGDLDFSYINNIDWNALMKSVIRKSQDAIISDELIVRGTINAKNVHINRLNQLKYPDEFVRKKNRDSVLMSGDKIFRKLHVGSLNSVKSINKIPISEFIVLNGDTTLDNKIIFHNLKIIGLLEINGEVKNYKKQIINGYSPIEVFDHFEIKDTDIYIKKFRVHRNIQISKTLNDKTWLDFDDLLLKGDDDIEITGKKVFLGRVEIGPGLEITSQKINGHLISEFMTLDTYQELPNLKKINANVTIGQLIESDVIQLERLLFENQLHESHTCLNKNFVFKVSPISDKISANYINGYISSNVFALKLNETFRNIIIGNISVINLHANEINPQTVNGLNYKEILLKAIQKSGQNHDENLYQHLDNLYEEIMNGSVSVRNLTVTGSIKTHNINNISLTNIYNIFNMDNVIFENDIQIKNLIIHGRINGVNFSEIVADALVKTDENIVISGKKKFDKIICDSLEFSKWNNRSIDDFLDPSKHQILTGPIIVKGNVNVEKYFNSTGKIGKFLFEHIEKNFSYTKNNTQIVNGNFQFITNGTFDIYNLIITDNIQNINFSNFIKSVVFLDSDNVKITGSKTFKNSISLYNFTITKKFNGINLKNYFHDVIRIDKPVSIKTKVIFQDNLTINDNLIIKTNLTSITISGIDYNELLSSAMYKNKPTIVNGTIIFNNLKLKSDINVDKINNIDIKNLLTLSKEQIIPATLKCQQITVGKLEVLGKLNGYNWSEIFDETLLITGDQNITGHIIFMGDVIVKNFDSKSFKGLDPNKLIFPFTDEIISGNFEFNTTLVLNGNLHIDGTLNKMNVSKWKNAVLKTGSSFVKRADNKQVIYEDCIIYGDVEFHGDIFGNGYLNDINIRKLKSDVSVRKFGLKRIIRKRFRNLQKICRELRSLEKIIDNRIYKYKYFDYLQIMKFDQLIVSIHHFDSDNHDYLFVNFDNCHVDCFVFNNNITEFTTLITMNNFGYVQRWITLKYRKVIYFLTLGLPMCNRSSGNLWKLVDNELILTIDFGNATDAKKFNNTDFFVIIDGVINYYSLENIAKNSINSLYSWTLKNKNTKLIPNTNRTIMIDDNSLYELKNVENNFTVSENLFKTVRVSSFHLGIFQRELFIYYDKKISENYLFIANSNFSHNFIDQIIVVNRPVSIRIINFHNYIENFLMFIENSDKIQIYEYKGIEGFVHRETIHIKAEKMYTFKLKIYPRIVKSNCIALLNNNRLIILEAKMYGEHIDINDFSCKNIQ